MDEAIISVKSITKSFKLYQDRSVNLKERALFSKRNQYKVHEVLKGISFSVKRGEAIALIGKNGCGKSTTLKMLSRIMYPDSGTIEMKGRVSALIELGAGFHPDMTGRENIYINAAIFGLSRKEIDDRLQNIIEFSELGEYIDNPVRTYSSGMYMRLAFSVAINVDADVLLIDEILAVGDAAFQAKCFNRLREIKAKGTTIVIVSHALGQIEQICDKSIWIKDGLIELESAPRDVHPAYLDYMGRTSRNTAKEKQITKEAESPAPVQSSSETEIKKKAEIETRWGNKYAEITKLRVLNSEGEESTLFYTGERVIIELSYKLNSPVQNPALGIGIFRNDGLRCYGTNTQIERIPVRLKNAGIVKCCIENLLLLPGEYSLDIAIHSEDGLAYDYWRFAWLFKMYSDISDVGTSRLEHHWEIF